MRDRQLSGRQKVTLLVAGIGLVALGAVALIVGNAAYTPVAVVAVVIAVLAIQLGGFARSR